MTFENLNIKETRNDLEKSLKNKSGIYMIINLINEKFYVGSAISNK